MIINSNSYFIHFHLTSLSFRIIVLYSVYLSGGQMFNVTVSQSWLHFVLILCYVDAGDSY